MREEENEGIVQLRILRTQVRGRAHSVQVEMPTPSPAVDERSHGALSDLLYFSTLAVSHVQEAIIQIMKMRKRINNAQLQTELVEILKNMFLPQKKMIKEQIEWLIDHKYIKRDETDINTFIYMA